MTWGNPFKTSSIFLRLVAAFLLLITPLYGFGLMMNRMGDTSVREEITKSMQSKVDFYISSLEREKEHMTKLLQEYVNDPELQQFTFLNESMSHFEWTQKVLSIESKLRLIRNSNQYIEGLSVHVLTANRSISSNAPISDRLAEEYEAVSGPDKSNGRTFIRWKDRFFLGLAYPEGLDNNRKPSYVISVEWSSNALRRALSSFSDEDSGVVLASPPNGWHVIHDTKGEQMARELEPFLKDRFERKQWTGIEPLTIDHTRYLVSYRYASVFDSYLCMFVPEHTVLGKLNQYRYILWLMSILSIVIILGYSYSIYRLIHTPLSQLIRSFLKVEVGQLAAAPLPKRQDEFRYLFTRFNNMVEYLKVLIHQVYEQKIRAQSSELKQLQSQINPHFLYNTYFILYRLAKFNDMDGVVRYSQLLGVYFQFITRSGSDQVTLEAEIKHARTYTDIQNIRFSNRIEVEFTDIPESCSKLQVPRLIVQPIIENAYKYALEGKRREGRIRVLIQELAEEVRIDVEDNGEALTDEHIADMQCSLDLRGDAIEVTGMINVHRRLQLSNGENSGITVQRGEWGGLKVSLHIRPAVSLQQD